MTHEQPTTDPSDSNDAPNAGKPGDDTSSENTEPFAGDDDILAGHPDQQ